MQFLKDLVMRIYLFFGYHPEDTDEVDPDYKEEQ
jgi:hypothetical protein